MNQKKLKRRIRECEKKIDNLKTLPYYSIFKQEGQRQKDIAKVEKKLFKLRDKYSVSACLPAKAGRSLQCSV